MKKEDELDFNLRLFLIENSSLFVIFGVFIALSMYLTQFISNYQSFISPDFPIKFFEIAIGSSFLVAFIVLLVILNELSKGNFFERVYEYVSDYMPNFPIGMFIRFLFLIPFFFLITGLLIFLYSTYPTVVTIFLTGILVVIAITLFILGGAIITNLTFPKKADSNVRKPISIYIIIYSIVVGVLSKLSLDALLPIIERYSPINTIFIPIGAFFWTLIVISILAIIFDIFIIALTIKIRRSKPNN